MSQQPQTKGKGKPRGPAPGPGKRPKVFPEALGMSHLLALTREITGAHEAVTQERMDKGKQREEKVLIARKERNKKIAERKKGPQAAPAAPAVSVGVEGHGWGKDGGREKERFPKNVVKKISKTSLKNSLKAAVREKNKKRKQARKAREGAGADDEVRVDASEAQPPTSGTTIATSAPLVAKKRVRMAEETKEEDAAGPGPYVPASAASRKRVRMAAGTKPGEEATSLPKKRKKVSFA